MNAITYIQQHGVEKVREVVEGATELDFAYDLVDEEYMRCGDIQDGFSIDDYEDCYLIEDLKRLVDSLDMVKEYGGITMAKRQCACFANACVSAGVKPSSLVLALQQAIADHEAIGGEHV